MIIESADNTLFLSPFLSFFDLLDNNFMFLLLYFISWHLILCERSRYIIKNLRLKKLFIEYHNVGEADPRTAFLRDSCFLFLETRYRALISGRCIYEAGEYMHLRVSCSRDITRTRPRQELCLMGERKKKKNRCSIQVI